MPWTVERLVIPLPTLLVHDDSGRLLNDYERSAQDFDRARINGDVVKYLDFNVIDFFFELLRYAINGDIVNDPDVIYLWMWIANLCILCRLTWTTRTTWDRRFWIGRPLSDLLTWSSSSATRAPTWTRDTRAAPCTMPPALEDRMWVVLRGSLGDMGYGKRFFNNWWYS